MRYLALLLLAFLSTHLPLQPLQAQDNRRRTLVLTDIENEPDDAQSLVRFLTYANHWDIEGIIATTSFWKKNSIADWRIYEILEAYKQVQPNLSLHESGYPSFEELKGKVKKGLPIYGLRGVGPDKDSEGSDWIIEVLEKEDDRPLWIQVWGGVNCLAQALWKIRETKSTEEAQDLYDKIRVYTISDQDDSGPWIRNEFPSIFYVCSPGYQHDGAGGYHYATWPGISGDVFHGRFSGGNRDLISKAWIRENIQSNHGPLGEEYPDVEYLMEGDTPSFLQLIDNGLSDPEHPNYGSWGGRYDHYQPRTRPWFFEEETRPFWTDTEDEYYSDIDSQYHTSNHVTIWRWREAYQHDFAARMDWCIMPYAEANHPPVAKLDQASELRIRGGERIQLSASSSTDPDDDELNFSWIQYKEAGTFPHTLDLGDADQASLELEIPQVPFPQTAHLIVAVTDDGTPSLTRYQRIILHILPAKPRVMVLTDINNAGGDPDDKQSLIHLMWYANELDIRGIIPDRWKGKGYQATMEGLATYEQDYTSYGFAAKGFPTAQSIRDKVAPDETAAIKMLIQEAMASDRPLYVLIWGQMRTFKKALFQAPEIAEKVRVLTIGTGRKYGPKDEVPGEDCNVVNWNGPGRNDIYQDSRFDAMWWLENNWTYNGMFSGERPSEMFQALLAYGKMGAHIKTVVKDHPWAQYFRVGDTPSVLYLIDPNHDWNDPRESSWAGKFNRPFPLSRPNYYTDHAGDIDWDYADPCNTWENLQAMYAHNKHTLEVRREDMYQALLARLDDLYGK